VYIFFLHLFACSFLAASVALTVFIFLNFKIGFFSGYIKIFKVLKSKHQIIDTFNSHN
jgi:hypothetical protein